MIEDNRLVAGLEQEVDTWQYNLRPKKIVEYIGQEQVKNNLEVFGLTVNDIEDISFNHILMIMKAFEKLSLINKINEDTLLNTTLKELSFINIKDAINNKEFIKVQKYINKNLIELSK